MVWDVPRPMLCMDGCVPLQGLNVGGGGGRTQEIKIRLRRAGDDQSFYPYEHVIGTMLHELVHNMRGPHDRSVGWQCGRVGTDSQGACTGPVAVPRRRTAQQVRQASNLSGRGRVLACRSGSR